MNDLDTLPFDAVKAELLIDGALKVSLLHNGVVVCAMWRYQAGASLTIANLNGSILGSLPVSLS